MAGKMFHQVLLSLMETNRSKLNKKKEQIQQAKKKKKSKILANLCLCEFHIVFPMKRFI